ncbi:Hypothetical predicted protein, partial [Pelobates cultripes]
CLTEQTRTAGAPAKLPKLPNTPVFIPDRNRREPLLPFTMGHNSKKYRADRPPSTSDIGCLLWRPQTSTKPVMVPLSDEPSYTSIETSLTDLRELEGKTRGKKADRPPEPATGSLVTEDTLKSLLDELRHNIAADISVFKEEPRRVSVCLHDTEVATAAHESQLTDLEQELSLLRRDQAQLYYHMAAIEDRRRWKNVKVCGLPNNIATAEIPHLIRKLFTDLFSVKQAKLMTLDGCYGLPAPPAGSTGVNRDVIIRFQNGPDKHAFMTAIHSKSPYSYEDH